MHAVRRHALRLLPQLQSPCRIIAGRRFALKFHRSAIAYRIPDDNGSDKANSRAFTQEPDVDQPPPLYPDAAGIPNVVEVADNDNTTGSFPEQVPRSKEQQS